MSATRLRSEPFSPVDAAWLHMDEPTNMAMITGVMLFDDPLDVDRLKAALESRLLIYDRFRQRVREPGFVGLPHWETDPHFDLDAHVHRIGMPAPGDVAALQTLVGDLMSTPLDFSKPLWQMHVVEGYSRGSALVVRLHHCVADGLALVQVLLSMTDMEPNAPSPEPRSEVRQGTSLLGAVLEPVLAGYNTASGAWRGATSALHAGWETLTDRSRMLDAFLLATAGALAGGKLVLSPPDRKTIFKGPCGVLKRVVWSMPVRLDEVKAIEKAADATVNDVLTTAVAGALRRYLEGRGQPTDGLEIRAMVPVSLRKPDELDRLGNRFGLVLLTLPVGVRDPYRRLLVLKHRMDDIKDTPEAAVAFGILNGMGMTSVQAEKLILKFFASKVSVVMTNVAGPREQLYLAGRPIGGFMFWVPAPGQLGMGISILSYRGEVMVGVNTDAGLVPDPEAIITGFHAELEEMREWVGPAEEEPGVTPKAAVGQALGN